MRIDRTLAVGSNFSRSRSKTHHHHQIRNIRRLQGQTEELRLKPQKVPPQLYSLIVNHNAWTNRLLRRLTNKFPLPMKQT